MQECKADGKLAATRETEEMKLFAGQSEFASDEANRSDKGSVTSASGIGTHELLIPVPTFLGKMGSNEHRVVAFCNCCKGRELVDRVSRDSVNRHEDFGPRRVGSRQPQKAEEIVLALASERKGAPRRGDLLCVLHVERGGKIRGRNIHDSPLLPNSHLSLRIFEPRSQAVYFNLGQAG